MRARPAAHGRAIRRPAARVPAEKSPAQAKADFDKGKEVEAYKVPPGGFSVGEWLISTVATYYNQPCLVAGVVVREQIESSERELIMEAHGTQNEEVLKYCTSQDQPALLRWHLCSEECQGLRCNPNLIHVKRIKKFVAGKGTGWETNLEEDEETKAIRADEERWKEKEKERKEKEKKDKEKEKKKEKKEKESSSSTPKGKKKKKKKSKKEKKKKKEEEDGGEEESPVSEVKKVGGRTRAKKSPEAVYQGTGMDPDASQRRRLNKKWREHWRRGRRWARVEAKEAAQTPRAPRACKVSWTIATSWGGFMPLDPAF